MRERIKVLLIYADRSGWVATTKDTFLQGILHLPKDYTPGKTLSSIPGALRVLKSTNWYARLSYVNDWKDAFEKSPLLDVESCSTNNLLEYRSYRKAIKEYPLVVVLHSATGDSMDVMLKTLKWFQGRRGKLIVFIGNEYNILKQKIRFLNETGADYVGTQLMMDSARWLYEESTAEVLETPHALNPDVYKLQPGVKKTVDVGFRGMLYLKWIGDMERTNILEYFRQHGAEHGLSCDIQIKKETREHWSELLSSYRAVVGAESGTYYLSRNDEIQHSVLKYEKENPKATFEEIYEKFFRDLKPEASGKCISSRHFEPIGTKTCQVLVKGDYNDILKADEHYISVEKDLSNVEEAIEKLKDETYCKNMADSTLEYVLDCHTYHKRVDDIIKTVVSGV